MGVSISQQKMASDNSSVVNLFENAVCPMPSDSAIRWEFEVQWRAKKEAMERKLSESLGRPRRPVFI